MANFGITQFSRKNNMDNQPMQISRIDVSGSKKEFDNKWQDRKEARYNHWTPNNP